METINRYTEEIKDTFSPFDASKVYSILEDYAQLFSKDDILNYLPYAVYGKAEERAADYVKLYLKDPSSYVEYDKYIGGFCEYENGLYYVVVNVEYGARNSFNAMVKETRMVYVYYSVKQDDISYKKSEFSKYDQWQMSR